MSSGTDVKNGRPIRRATSQITEADLSCSKTKMSRASIKNHGTNRKSDRASRLDRQQNSFADFMAQSISQSIRVSDQVSTLYPARLPTITDAEVPDRRNSQSLTSGQVSAFREVFELFDKNGGGTIDASELQKTLADVDINIDGADLNEVMLTLDGDGNGEVDFDEFLKLMTDTEMFIEALAEKNKSSMDAPSSKRVVLFDALTQFMRKQALRNANEIVSYYTKKCRKDAKKFMYAVANKGAHVVQHYADGARLIGLTDAQLFKQLKLLQSQVNAQILDEKELQSPYAKSFHAGLLRSLMRDRHRKSPAKPVALGGPKPKVKKHLKDIKQMYKMTRIVAPKIKIRFLGLHGEQSVTSLPKMNVYSPSQKQIDRRKKSMSVAVHRQEADRPVQHLPGWTTHRTRVTNVDIIIQSGWSKVPINRIKTLKEIVYDAKHAYSTRVACEKMGTNLKLYRSLNTRTLPTIGLRAQMNRCMVAYSSATSDDLAGKITPSLLGAVLAKDNILMMTSLPLLS